MWVRVCYWRKTQRLYIAPPATQWSGLSQWKSTGQGPKSELHSLKKSQALRVPTLLAFSYFLQSWAASHLSEAKTKKKTHKHTHTHLLLYNIFPKSTPQGAWCVQAERGGFRHMLCSLVMLRHPKQKDMMLQSRQSAIQGAKRNKTQTNWLMNAFFNHLLL